MSCTKRQACLGEWSSSGAGLSSRQHQCASVELHGNALASPWPSTTTTPPAAKGLPVNGLATAVLTWRHCTASGVTPRRRRLNGSSLLKTNLPAASLCVSSAHTIPSAGTLAISPAERSTTSPMDRVLHPLMFPSSLQTAHECESSRRSAQILHWRVPPAWGQLNGPVTRTADPCHQRDNGFMDFRAHVHHWEPPQPRRNEGHEVSYVPRQSAQFLSNSPQT